MNIDQQWWLDNLCRHFKADPSQLRKGFEVDFVTDLGKRMEEEGTDLFVSGRMMEILIRIGTDRYGMDWEQFKSCGPSEEVS